MIGRQVDTNGDGTWDVTQRLVYDGSNLVLMFDGSGNIVHRLLNGPAVNQVLADENGSGTVSWYLADNEGTVRDVVQYNSGTDTTSVVDHLKFDSFGNITSQSNSSFQPMFAFAGMLWDNAANLYFDRARWYDPTSAASSAKTR